MKKIKFLLFVGIILSCVNLHAQIKFLNGSVTDSLGNTYNCLIKFIEWRKNPVLIEYKFLENSPTLIGTAHSIKSFTVEGLCCYQSFNVQIDQSSNFAEQYSKSPEPEWAQKQVFLRVLLSGKASLYYYEDQFIHRFFYSIDNDSPVQLVYKQYVTDDSEAYAAENMKFRQQLWSFVQCSSIKMEKLENIGYNTHELIRYFIDYNECMGTEPVLFDSRKNDKRFHLRVAPGIVYTSLKLEDLEWYKVKAEISSKWNPLMALETEFILPYNRNKWAVVFNPEYHQFKQTGIISGKELTIDYQEVEFPIGIRYYFFLKNGVKIFLNGYYIPLLSLNFNSSIDIKPYTHFETKPSPGLYFGGGVTFKKVSAEIRYYTTKSITNTMLRWDSKLNRTGLFISYQIL